MAEQRCEGFQAVKRGALVLAGLAAGCQVATSSADLALAPAPVGCEQWQVSFLAVADVPSTGGQVTATAMAGPSPVESEIRRPPRTWEPYGVAVTGGGTFVALRRCEPGSSTGGTR